ncbi:ribosome maturation factor RimP [Campylobacterota bacterium]|nr:ribosome maturation factor RimP [Campylobacterota bacterium]
MNDLSEQLSGLIATCDAKLYDTELVREGTNTIFRVYLEREGGVDVELCARVSRLISPLLDVLEPCHEAYTLEVSSRGLERRLRTIEHFLGAIGEVAKITLTDKTRIKGRIDAVANGSITIAEHAPIDFATIAKAKIVYLPNKEA